MSKSLRRVRAAIETAELDCKIIEMGAETRTAQQAADAAGCELDQIAKSIIFEGAHTGQIYLFVTAGGNHVDPLKAAALAGEPMQRADAVKVRSQTGFAIGGVSPLGHLNPVATFFDRRLAEFDEIWAAAGTPRHIFKIKSQDLQSFLNIQPIEFTS